MEAPVISRVRGFGTRNCGTNFGDYQDDPDTEIILHGRLKHDRILSTFARWCNQSWCAVCIVQPILSECSLLTDWGCSFPSTFGRSWQIGSLECGLLHWTHVTDSDCWKDKLLVTQDADVYTDRITEIRCRQSVDAVDHSSRHCKHSNRPVTFLHNP